MTPLGAAHVDDALALNNAHATELSRLEPDALRALIDQAFYAVIEPPAEAFLIALDHTATYASPNYAWHRARHDRFVYVDRLVVAPAVRGRGLARLMYAGLFAAARAAGHEQVLCEVNRAPPNPASDRLHSALGFVPIGEAIIHGGAKTVRYLRVTL